MNNKQLRTIYIAIAILSVMLIFPPWQFRIEHPNSHKLVAGPYHFIFFGAPSVPVTSKTEYGERFNDSPQRMWKTEIDWIRLVFPCAVVIIIASSLVLYNRGKQEKNGDTVEK